MSPNTEEESWTKILISGLQDPMNHESCCLPNFLDAVHVIREAGKDEQKYSPVLLRAIMQFFLTPQTDQQLTDLVRRLVSCTCLQDSFTQNGIDMAVDPLRMFDAVFSYLCGFIIAELERATRGRFRRQRADRPADLQPWPNSPGDIGLGDRDVRTAVTILLRWSAGPPVGHSIFGVLGTLSRFWEPYARATLENPRLNDFMRRQLHEALEFYVHPRPDYWDLFERIITSCRILAVDLSTAVTELNNVYPEFEEEIYDFAAPMIPLLIEREPHMRPALEWFSRMLHSRRIPFPGAITWPRGDAVRENNDYFHARLEMILARRNSRCMHVHCPAETGTTVSSLCRRCSVIRYCGREHELQCQTAAWRAEKHPHKDFCDIVHRLRQRLDMLNHAKWDAWLMPATDVPEAVSLLKASDVKKTTCRAIWLNLTLLKTVKKLVKPKRLNVKGMRASKIEHVPNGFYLSIEV
ncbi:hypothetical protein B0H16DRAFT_1762064 [Mycena metata]|uniref:MYND-type domain-containing protein n=1 Tax=Mycena metata TaxID=1033252 RepID=A0AAD7IAQ4_9AGAR|nr:hypothetical protein B0H16DRAFT_1762064 [Mycena metata]